ncbi:MAG: hypothetical protein E7675_01325 [Ruminococcaceae bacterium]|nr:hypothetical protein [Oscillospiraceae bacterium]
MAKEKFNLYNLFVNRTAKNDATGNMKESPKNITNYFVMLWRNISRIFNLNLVYVLGNFPIFFLLLASSGIVADRGVSPQSSMFGTFFGSLNYTGQNPVSAALFAVHGVQVEVNVSNTWTYVLMGLTLLIFLTFGYINAAVSLSMRNIVKSDPVYIIDGIKTTIKKNKFQALFVGILDLLIMGLIVYDIMFFYANANTGNFIFSVFLGISIFVAVFYLFARMYLYPMLVTFKISTRKLFKNAIIFSIVGLKRNFLGFVAIVAVILMNYAILELYMPIGIILPFILTLGIIEFTMTYAAWPKIHEVMVEPYYNDDGSEKSAE